MLDNVLGHFVNLVGVSRHFLVEDTGPNESIKLEVRVFLTFAVDVKVEVQISSDGEHVVVKILNLFRFPENIDVFHLLVGHFVVSIDQILSELESILVFRKVSESLVDKPDVHICDRVVDMEIVGDVHGVDEFPGINVHEHSLEQGGGLHHRPLVSPLESFGVGKIGEHSSQFGGFLNILMNIHALQSLIEIKRYELGLGVSKVLIVVHPVVGLILEPVQIAHSPSDLEPVTLFLTVILLLLHLLRNVHSFNIELQWCKLITFVELMNDLRHLFVDIILFGFFQQLRN